MSFLSGIIHIGNDGDPGHSVTVKKRIKWTRHTHLQLPGCPECGVLVSDTDLHQTHHDRIEEWFDIIEQIREWILDMGGGNSGNFGEDPPGDDGRGQADPA